MTKPTTRPARSTPAVPAKLRDVPPWEPPSGYRWCRRNEPREGAFVVGDDGSIAVPAVGVLASGFVGDHPGDIGDGVSVWLPYVRPLPVAQPKRAKVKSIREKALAAARKLGILNARDYINFESGYYAGTRAARRRAAKNGGASK